MKELVYNLDVVPTILAATGAEIRGRVDGQDLTPLLTGTVGWSPRPYLTSAMNNFAWLLDDNHCFNVRIAVEAPRLVDVRADPAHEHDLAAERPAVVRDLFELIRADAGGDLPTYERPTTFADGSVPRL